MKILGQGLLTLFYLSIGFLYIAGGVHSCKKHRNDSDVERYSPFALYRGAEMFWHDDFKGVDWNQRLKGDVYVLYQMMTTLSENEKKETIIVEVEKFSNRILAYPNSKVQYLKNAGQLIYRYMFTLRGETLSYIDSILAGNYRFDSKNWDKESKVLEDSIVNHYGFLEVEGTNKSIDSVLISYRFSAAFGEREKVEEAQNEIKNLARETDLWMFRIYEMIFKEQLSRLDSYRTSI